MAKPSDPGPPNAQHYAAAAEFVLMLRQAGQRDTAVLRAMEQVPRVPFLPDWLFDHADADLTLPIGCGQSILSPSLTGLMIEALSPQPGDRVLEIGTGSGYAAAVLARLAASVVTIERWRRLADEAHARLRGLGYDMIDTVFGDGLQGYSPRSPFQRILLSCSVEAVPEALTAQLADGGCLVAPIGPADLVQTVTRLVRKGDGIVAEPLFQARVRAAVPGTARFL